MHKTSLVGLAALLVAGCVTPPTEADISARLIGMPRADLLACMPRPDVSRPDGDTERLQFSRTDVWMGLQARCGLDVSMKAGRVASFSIDASGAGMNGARANICRELLRKCVPS